MFSLFRSDSPQYVTVNGQPMLRTPVRSFLGLFDVDPEYAQAPQAPGAKPPASPGVPGPNPADGNAGSPMIDGRMPIDVRVDIGDLVHVHASVKLYRSLELAVLAALLARCARVLTKAEATSDPEENGHAKASDSKETEKPTQAEPTRPCVEESAYERY